ncbi:CxxH/CxxC protein, partial [Bacillus sp. D-CC]
MNLPCCLEHVELALDIIVDECEVPPVIHMFFSLFPSYP